MNRIASAFSPIRLFVPRALTMVLGYGCLHHVVGCFLPPGNGGDPSNGFPADGDNDNDSPDPRDLPVVRLTVSNPSPQVGETVRLQCRILSGDATNAVYAFTPAERITVDTRTGDADFIVDAADVGTEFEFTCRTTSASGEGPGSNRATFIPFSSEP